MYTKREYVYADPYRMLVGGGVRVYQIKGKAQDYTEIECPLDDMAVFDGMAFWGGGCVMELPKRPTYEAIKTTLVKLRYSNDDQLAILCNGDEEEMARMQSWRDWASDVSKTICRKIGVKC